MSVIQIKLELAELSLKANRLEEAEKTIMDVILDSSTDSESLYSAFIALGSIKMIKYLKGKVIFSEVEYCYKKAYSIKQEEFTADAYLLCLSNFFKLATEAIELSNRKLKELQVKAAIDIIVTVSSAYVLNQRNNSLLTNVVGIIGLDYGVSGIVDDINTYDGFKNLINHLNNCILEVINNYNKSIALTENQNLFFEDEINKNNLRKFLSSDKKGKQELLFEIFDEAIEKDINFNLKEKSKVLSALNDGNVGFSNILLHLKNKKNVLKEYFREDSEKIYFGFTNVNNFDYNIIFFDNQINILKCKDGILNLNKEPEQKFEITYEDFFSNKVEQKEFLNTKEMIFILPDGQRIKLFEFKAAFKQSTRDKQDDILKKIIELFN